MRGPKGWGQHMTRVTRCDCDDDDDHDHGDDDDHGNYGDVYQVALSDTF